MPLATVLRIQYRRVRVEERDYSSTLVRDEGALDQGGSTRDDGEE